ncbi:RNA polymerase II subunit 5-mediating protein homolog isoform X2 [Solanum pennellii]|uniref:RNA polymerase II subunit 5-mediating protein homolog isoform X2 n=1 Tax=Solanum pennellii TaxID=28526 RepID=A0ABM1HA99_SOLPN|nr:RNA polymerase II subunit 5-mediating protein homolog isoform X2 [Solanum pennellii]
MAESVKGTVTSLSSLFPVEEAQKAAKRVEEIISERQKQLDQLRDFAADNNTLIRLVQRLPDELHHDIMVPFGKAAFFPGRLIHTNEFLVLLGEGYYAERTAKQTVGILNRRGKALEVQVESVKALMQDLKAEASFFDATASEAAEGLVEIREDYVEETSPKEASMIGIVEPKLPISSQAEDVSHVKDEEYDRIFSRLAELEKEEEEAEHANQEEIGSDDSDVSPGHVILEEEMKSLELEERGKSSRFQSTEKFPDHWHVEGSKATSKENCLPENLAYGKFNLTENAPVEPQAEEDVKAPVIAETKAEARPSEPQFDSSKAFTGSIVEHNSDVNSKVQSVSRSSKPVSRFKMQRK